VDLGNIKYYVRSHSTSGKKCEEKCEHVFNYHDTTTYGRADVKLHAFTIDGLVCWNGWYYVTIEFSVHLVVAICTQSVPMKQSLKFREVFCLRPLCVLCGIAF
jgi:hypothetical protein